MEAISLVYIAFSLFGIASFAFLPAARAISIIYFTGLIFLPVSSYPALDDYFPGTTESSPYWILGVALPTDALINKAWIASITAFAGALLFDIKSIRQFRPKLIDFPMAAWCIWPLVQNFALDQSPPGWQSSLYLTGVWALPWFLGRIYFTCRINQLILIDSLTKITVLLVPFAIVEGFSGIRFYEYFYGDHPFSAVGAERYWGYRPLIFFEDGNQYGLWTAMAAILAFWQLKSEDGGQKAGLNRLVAWALILIVIASQSIGAILLMFAGLAALHFHRILHHFRKLVLPALVLVSILSAVHISGVVPIRALAKETTIGQTALSILRNVGRGSLSWRISQDEKTIPAIRERMTVGSGQWDWWRELGRRPWGLPLLVIGQFGLIGLFLAISSPLAAIISRWRRNLHDRTEKIEPSARASILFVSGIIIFATAIDSLLNAFIFLPALIFAGSLVVSDPKRDV
ncbi:MAG: hypothetical protein ABJO01_01920 [Parasphingorhabdus sp.]|uniref:hypothetical protein n=1 Tax=Parasphingorhabdus sp. TaxID=2709688 RepID=UPI0032984444